MTEPVSCEGRAAYSVPAGKRYTYQEYLQLNDELRYELAEGELRVVPAPGIEHQEIVGNLYWLLAQYVRETRAGKVLVAPVDVYLDQYNTAQPDLLFIAGERLSIITDKNIQGAPDLVIEVLSPATARRDRLEKSRTYLRYGVREFWLVDPRDRLVEVRVAEPSGWKLAGVFDETAVLSSPLLSGLQIDLKQVFDSPGESE